MDNQSNNKKLDVLHNEIETLRTPGNKKLLINYPWGAGKTITTLKYLCENDIRFIYLRKSHSDLYNVIHDNELKQYDIVHFKGRSSFVDENKTERVCPSKLAPQLLKKNIPIKNILCNKDTGLCEHRTDCYYKKQMKEIIDYNPSWVGTYGIMHTPVFKEAMYDVLVLDEDPLNSLVETTTFNSADIQALETTLNELAVEYPHLSTYIDSITTSMVVLREILEETGVELTGKKFIERFFKGLEGHNYDFNILEDCYKTKSNLFYFHERYNDLITRDVYQQKIDNLQLSKNILQDVKKVINFCLDYYQKDCTVPVYAKRYRDDKKPEIVIHIGNKKLPKKPTIFLDATGDKELLEYIFKKQFVEATIDRDIVRNIKQTKDGVYYLKTLQNDSSRNRVFGAVALISKQILKEPGINKIYFIICKPFTTEVNALIATEESKNAFFYDYEHKSLEYFLLKSGVKRNQFEIYYHDEMRGKNIKDLMFYGKLIGIGVPEPNWKSYPEQISSWHIGEEPISTNRYSNTGQYKDPRYALHVRRVRENQIMHTIERQRYIIDNSIEKETIWFSSLDFGFNTDKKTIDELLIERGLKKTIEDFPTYKLLRWLNKRKSVTGDEFQNNTRQYVENVNVFKKNLEENKFIEIFRTRTKGKPLEHIQMTNGGKKYHEHLEKQKR